MGDMIRAAQLAAFLVAACAFSVWRKADVMQPSPQEWLLGASLAGLLGMWLMTFCITLFRFGPKAAFSLRWS